MTMLKNAWRLAALLLATAPALAEEPLLLGGIGLGAERTAYRGVDVRVRPLPLLIYENEWVSVAGPTLDLKLPDAGPLQFRLRTRYGFDGYKAKDAPELSGMARRKGSLWVGAAVLWEHEWVQVGLDGLADASGNSKGRQWRLQLEHRMQLGERLELTPRLGLQYLDSKYVDYYYGVRAAEARAGRAVYTGEAAKPLELGLRVSYQLAPRQMLIADASLKRLGREVDHSPLVARRYEAGLFTGWLYRF